jgi:CubicO group peptidase (beta-lactamase class C family)
MLLAFSVGGISHAQAPAAAAITAAPAPAFNLEADVTRVMKTFDVPGIAIAVVKDGKVLATRGFGVRKLGEPAPVDGKTLFEIASNSKAFTAAALAMLVDEGKLAWDDPVTRHLPDFQMYDAYVTHEMTVRDLLTHRSGLGLGAGDLLWWPTTGFSTDEIIEKLRYIRPATSFRSSYAYDNLLYIVAGKIIAQKSGKSWGDTVRERILKPVGMTTTTTSLAENAGNPNVAHSHSKIADKISVVKAVPAANAVGAVGINTSAEDIARWMTVLLDGGKLEGKDAAGKELRLFSAAQSREMWTAQTPIRISEPKPALAATMPNFSAYGLGFQLRDYKGMKLAMHGGALQGFYSRVLLVPEAKLGIAILTNAESGGALTPDQRRKRRRADVAAVSPARPVPRRRAERLDHLDRRRRAGGARQGTGAHQGRRQHARGEVAAVAGAGGLRRRVPGPVVRQGHHRGGRREARHAFCEDARPDRRT